MAEGTGAEGTRAPEVLAADLLAWYDRMARVMPWRVPPAARAAGLRPDPYHVWLSEVMLQQTTVAAVRSYFERFVTRWPTVSDLAAAEDADVMAAWAGLGYYARARNLLKCARAVAREHRGRFPETEAGLRALPGIGPYTAAAIAAIAFDRPETVLDGNVERVIARLRAVEEPLPGVKERLRALAAEITPAERPGDYAQAIMDLGATVCSPRAPACGICPWRDDCAGRMIGVAAELPRKTPKLAKPTRRGIAYLALRPDGSVLVERRPDQGLLGGMLALPSGPWAAEAVDAPPFAAAWRDLGVEVRHTFTHFHLRLALFGAAAPARGRGDYRPRAGLAEAMPTVMRKALVLGLDAMGE
ncbi:MAG: A/G-specific adenine glycosylase [Rhodovulum sulfidophilum]|uniref:Adenine DNA glycosylase n=1 Tax=Rhodovulum sulfidophilum TaxID=35806 RepID=A0A2W5NJH6_RHOSU|nr:MAG: A/G-specific adenine glycosylase [Rhodovulum sulfidophilum]